MPLEQLVEQWHRQTYGDNVMMVAQQLQNPLRAAVTEKACTGVAHRVADLVGTGEYLVAEARARTNPENPSKLTARWLVRPDKLESGQYIDEEDKLDLAMDPTSHFVRDHTARVNRGVMDRILGVKKVGANFEIAHGGILGKVNEGKNPGTATDLPAGNYIAASATGLTIDKMIEVKEDLAMADFGIEDDDPLYALIGPKQVTNLLKIADASSSSLNAFAIDQLKTGKPTPLMGMTWIVTNRLPKNADGHRLCPVWSKRNIVAGFWQDIQGDMWNDTHAKKLPYVYVSARLDCARAQDGGVRVITCVET
jgi:hypothetical protein